MVKLENDSFKGLLVHLFIMGLIVALLVILFFFVYLPYATNHGQSITVPNIVGMKVDELDDFLSAKDLKYEVGDSVYTTKYPPYAVVKQYPEEGFQVKEGRKISITLNRKSPELIKMPQLVGTSVKNALMIAQSHGLQTEIKYVPNRYQNLVLKQLIDGKVVVEGSPVYQGTKVTIEAGDPSIAGEIPVPNYIGEPIDEVEIAIKGQGFKMAEPMETDSPEPKGTVVKQRPASGSGENIKPGETIYLWISNGNDGSDIDPENTDENDG